MQKSNIRHEVFLSSRLKSSDQRQTYLNSKNKRKKNCGFEEEQQINIKKEERKKEKNSY